jgi:hypothetical protein
MGGWEKLKKRQELEVVKGKCKNGRMGKVKKRPRTRGCEK